MKKHVFIFILLSLINVGALAQSDGLSVKRFTDVSQSRLYARASDAPKDNMGNNPALLLVQVLSDSEASFSANYMLGNVEKKGNEYWVYMAEGAKYIEISLPRYEKIRVVFNEVSGGTIPSLVSKSTYELVINVPGEVVAPSVSKRQFFKFFVEPEDANVRVLVDGDWQWWPAEEGLASKSLDYGNYTYEVSHDRYHTQTGTIMVSQSSQQLEVKLRPMFGWLNIPCDKETKGAYVFATNVRTGTPVRLGQLPVNYKEMESSTYLIEIQKEKFKDFRTTVVIADGDTTVIIPQIDANAAQVTLQAESGVEIYLDNQLLGANQWMGVLECGSHEIEARKPGHHSAYTRIDVLLQESTQTFVLNLPVQKYGSLTIYGKPNLSTVYVDGEMIGKTPIMVNQIAFGEHTVRIEKAGYQSVKKKVIVDQEEELLVDYNLVKSDEKSTPKPEMESTPKSAPKETIKPEPKTKPEPKAKPEPKVKAESADKLIIKTFALANAGLSFKDQLWGAGLMFGQMYNGYGWYVKGRSNFQKVETISGISADEKGAIMAGGLSEFDYNGDNINDIGVVPFYTGNKSGSEWVVNAGFAMNFLAKKKNSLLGLYAGVGYGSTCYALETTGKQWITYAPWSTEGLSLEAGLMGGIGGFTIAAGVNTIGFKMLEAEVSIGWTF